MGQFEMYQMQSWEDGGGTLSGGDTNLSAATFSKLLHGKMISKFDIEDGEWAKITFTKGDFLRIRTRGTICSLGYSTLLKKGEVARPIKR